MWTDKGITYEADQRHADIVIKELGLDNAKSVTTPSNREDIDKMLADIGSELPPGESTQYRALAARLHYFALGRSDIQYATEEVAKYMTKPSQGNWLLFKRLAPVFARRSTTSTHIRMERPRRPTMGLH